MEIKSILEDKKVSAKSILIEIKVRDYLTLAKSIFKLNEFQRKRVRSSKTVYSLLKSDLLTGCVMPPLVLAYREDSKRLEHDLRGTIENDSQNFVILDGLQRSHTLMDIESETSESLEIQEDFLNRAIRCEIYAGINRLGILYRMLTLNTGQTAMSLRQQIEIMYLDYLKVKIDGVQLIKEADGIRARQVNEYNFRDTIEGFNSYLERSESPLDRGDILDNITSLENLAKENGNHDIFRDFVISWSRFISKIDELDMSYPEDDYKLDSFDADDKDEPAKRLWGTTGVQAFKRSQALSGFGAAVGLLRDDDSSLSFSRLPLDKIQIGNEPDEFMYQFNKSIENINQRAKRIGNAQRLFFRQFFKMLLWQDSGCYLNLYRAQEEAYKSSIKIGI